MSGLAPGVHSDVAPDAYHALDACSSSRLRDMGRSPAYCRHKMNHPKPATAAMILGSLVHALVLEPGAVEGRYAIKDYDARTKAGKSRRDELATAGIEVLSEADWSRANDIAEAAERNSWWDGLEDVQTEVTAVWTDGEHDSLCKARPDIYGVRGGVPVLADLKVCRQAAQPVYPRQAVSLFHPQQLAWYARGLGESGLIVAERWILAVHPEPPHEVTPYLMSADLNRWADESVYARFLAYEECRVANAWPDGAASEVVVPLPEWMADDDIQVDDEVATEDDK